MSSCYIACWRAMRMTSGNSALPAGVVRTLRVLVLQASRRADGWFIFGEWAKSTLAMWLVHRQSDRLFDFEGLAVRPGGVEGNCIQFAAQLCQRPLI